MTIRKTKLDSYDDVNRMRKSLEVFGLYMSYRKKRGYMGRLVGYEVIISDEKITDEIKKQYLGSK